MWSYGEALEWLYGRQALGIKLGLDKVHDLLARVGDPQRRFRSVHVAGTNGKGSVTRMLADVLRRSGHRVGAFTSPHLVHFTERVVVDGEEVPREEVARLLWDLRPVVEALDREERNPTFFEVNTALAFLHFAQRGVDWAVVETGMGGRLDATNVLAPELTVITNVERDHAEFLGEHVAGIAMEKGGIMKPGVPCVTGARDGALHVLKHISRERRCPMSVVGEDYQPVPDINGFRLVHPGGDAHYDLAMAGAHQIDNAALVVAAADALRSAGHRIPQSAVQQSLATVTVPGRMERFPVPAGRLVPDAPEPERTVEVLIDGAHNEAGARALRFHLGRLDWSGFHLVAGFSRDKDWTGMLDQWMPLAAHVWATPLRSARSLDPAPVVEHCRRAGFPADAAGGAAEGLREAVRAGAHAVVVAGSLFLVGEVRALLTGQDVEEVRGSQ